MVRVSASTGVGMLVVLLSWSVVAATAHGQSGGGSEVGPCYVYGGETWCELTFGIVVPDACDTCELNLGTNTIECQDLDGQIAHLGADQMQRIDIVEASPFGQGIVSTSQYYCFYDEECEVACASIVINQVTDYYCEQATLTTRFLDVDYLGGLCDEGN